MITLDFQQLFKTDPNFSKVPKKVFDWVITREKEFPVNYQINFREYKNENEKDVSKVYEMIFISPHRPFDILFVSFPLSDGCWIVKITGLIARDGTLIPFADLDNPEHDNTEALGPKRIEISGLKEYFEKDDPLLERIPNSFNWGYKRKFPITSAEIEMVEISCDRNINDEWEFRGTPQEFMDQKVKPLLN